MTTYGIITNIQVYSIHDGPGIRTLVFLKGCPLSCRWCCNPECINREIEIEFFNLKCIGCGACLMACTKGAINPDLEVGTGFKIDIEKCDKCGDCIKTCLPHALKFVGERMSVDEVLDRVKKDRVFYMKSGGGVTISGGEPLYQFEFTRELLEGCYDENIHTAIETCGFASWEKYRELLKYLDLILYDIKHMISKSHQEITGRPNEPILENLKKLSQDGTPIIIRLPLIPDHNLDDENIKATAEFISTLDNIEEVNLMPFHQFGKDKYERLCREYVIDDLIGMQVQDGGKEKLDELKRLFESYGFKVLVGG